MIHANQAATDYQMGFSLASPTPSSNPVFATESTVFQFTETWGNAYSAGTMGMRITVTDGDNAPSPNTVRVQAVTPWFSYDSGAVTGWDTTGAFYFVMYGAQLTVHSDCTWTLSFVSLEFWGPNGSGTPVVLDSTGAQTMSGTSYDERLNGSFEDPFTVEEAAPVTLICDGTIPPAGSWSATFSMTGGYKYKVGGDWFEDPTSVDSSTAGGSCACLAGLPVIAGASSYSMVAAVAFTGSIVLGSTSVECPSECTASTQGYATELSTFVFTSATVFVKGQAPNLRSQTIATAWECQYSGVTEGSSASTASTAKTTCSSTRTVQEVQQFLACAIAPIVACTPPFSCGPGPASWTCEYTASAALTWPTAPACMAPLVNALGYDVSLFGEHCVSVAEGGSDHIVLGIAGDVPPQVWSYLDTGLTGTWARPRYQDLGSWSIGLFYGDGTNCYWAQTNDNGVTWVNTTSMASGTIGDFDEGADGLRWFFKLVPNMSSTWDVWSQVLDSQLNVVRAWTITNVTGVDDAPIACRESVASDGSWRIGLWFSVGGVANVKFAPDGLSFS